MRKRSIYQLLAAYGLLVVLVLPLGMQGLHPWLDDHKTQAHCDSDAGQVHIHDQSYAIDHCFVCTFHYSHYTESVSSVSLPIPGWRISDLLIEGDQIPVKPDLFCRSPRAPPAYTA